MVLDENLLMGQVLYGCMKKEPDAIAQIDEGTGESETYKSVLDRSVRLALSLRKLGLKPGDIMSYTGKNHLELHIPYYAAVMNGLPVNGIDPTFKYDEIKSSLQVTYPKIVFCDPECYEDYVKALRNLGTNTKVFKPAVIDQNAYCMLVSTGGTTGVFKTAAFTYKSSLFKVQGLCEMLKNPREKRTERSMQLNMVPVHWVSSYFLSVFPILVGDTIVQTSAPLTGEHATDIFNKYKPETPMLSPSVMAGILKSDKPCDLSNIKLIILTGAKAHKDILIRLKKILPKTAMVFEMYGQTENLGPVLQLNPFAPLGSCGTPMPNQPIKLVDPETGKDITEPNVTGELWTKCTFGMKEYYNNPEETAKAFENGWFKTGDLMYRDADNNYYFVERIKMLIKYRNYHIVPTELEAVIHEHPGVEDVCVTSIPHLIDSEHAVACVVRTPGSDVTEEEICQLVADKLSENKKLRGGVLFMDQLPYTSTGKIARGKLKQFVLEKLKDKIEA